HARVSRRARGARGCLHVGRARRDAGEPPGSEPRARRHRGILARRSQLFEVGLGNGPFAERRIRQRVLLARGDADKLLPMRASRTAEAEWEIVDEPSSASRAAPPAPVSSSRQLGRYHLIGQLARGGMGVVYLAASRGPGGFSKLLVLKELKPELAEEP